MAAQPLLRWQKPSGSSLVVCSSSMTAEGVGIQTDEDDTAALSNTQAQSRRTWGNAHDVTYDTRTIMACAGLAAIVGFICRDVSIWHGLSIREILAHSSTQTWVQYSEILSVHPIETKACTSATVYTIGDVIAQHTEGRASSELDWMRVVRSMMAGFVGHGPMSHYWYNACDGFFVNVLHLTAWWSFIPKIVVDQTVWGPIWNNIYLILLGMMKMERPETIWNDVKTSTIPLLISGLKIWPAAHMVTYGLIPVENRLLWVDMVEILWVTILATQAAGLSLTTNRSENSETSEKRS
jgi:protein Mpv17